MTFRYIVYPSCLCRLYKMVNAIAGEVIWSSCDNDLFIGREETAPCVITRDGDFEGEADSLEQFIEKHIEKFL